MIQVGDILKGFCNGWFGRDSYGDKRVEGVGKDWIVARDIVTGHVQVATGEYIHSVLEEHKQ